VNPNWIFIEDFRKYKKLLVIMIFIRDSLISLVLMLNCGAWAELNVAYFTDVEGSRQRFEGFLASSKAFYLGEDGKYHLKPEAHFVFGGDAPDRYLGSRWVVSELVRLKEETPDRVALIIGNRDINKIRLTSELSLIAITRPPFKFHFTKDEEWQKHVGPETRAERLKYIFSQTMGAPNAFNLRRQELALELKATQARFSDADVSNAKSDASISDADVVDSYLQELGPNGKFRKFLELGQLAHRIENTLFVHGGVTRRNLGRVPGDVRKCKKIDDWIYHLNQWYRTGVKIWTEQDQAWSGTTLRPEQAWLDYPMPDPGLNSKPESVVTGRNTDLFNNPLFPTTTVVAELLNQGIERLVIGHTPTADYPVILRTGDERFEVVFADNSFSHESFASLVHFEGPRLERTLITGKVTLTGRTAEVFSELTLRESTLLGKMIKDGYALGNLRDDPNMLVTFHYGENFRIVTDLHIADRIDRSDIQEPGFTCESFLGFAGK
jgi:hypothetical protein